MKQIFLIFTFLFSNTILGQTFFYDVIYEGSNGDSLIKTEGTFKISKVRKTNFGFHKGILTIKTDNLNVREKIVFFYYPDGDNTFFDIGIKPKNPIFDRIVGMPITMSFFLNDNTVYYIQMKPPKRKK